MHPLAGSFNPRVLVKSCFSSDYSFDASRVYQGKIINFIGTGPMPPVTTVDESGNFTSVFKVEDRIDGNQNVQATFEGDEHYAKSESNIVVYETVPHDTRLTIEIDPLRLALPGTKSQPQISLKPDEEFRISGLLLDASRNIPIPSKKIFFENNFDLIFLLSLMLMATTMSIG